MFRSVSSITLLFAHIRVTAPQEKIKCLQGLFLLFIAFNYCTLSAPFFFFKILSNFVHFCRKFQIFCSFSTFLYPFSVKSHPCPYFLEYTLPLFLTASLKNWELPAHTISSTPTPPKNINFQPPKNIGKPQHTLPKHLNTKSKTKLLLNELN